MILLTANAVKIKTSTCLFRKKMSRRVPPRLSFSLSSPLLLLLAHIFTLECIGFACGGVAYREILPGEMALQTRLLHSFLPLQSIWNCNRKCLKIVQQNLKKTSAMIAQVLRTSPTTGTRRRSTVVPDQTPIKRTTPIRVGERRKIKLTLVAFKMGM